MPKYSRKQIAVASQKAQAYILAHPYESKIQQVVGSGFSERTIARARAELVRDGKLPVARNAQPAPAPPSPPPPQPPVSVAKPSTLFDHEAMKAMAEMVDQAVEMGDDEKVQKALLKQCLTFAFRPDLHPDTRMSASTMWAKLRDMSKAKDLGPGKPKTREEAARRAADMLIALGPEITMEAVNMAFNVKGAPDASTVEQAATSGSPAQDASAARHEGDPKTT